MNRVVHFEIHAEDPQKVVEFYSTLFGWQFQKWGGPEEYWLIKTGEDDTPGIDGGLVKRRGQIDGEAVIAYVCTIEVDSVDYKSKEAERYGGKVVVPKSPIPGVGWLIYCKDPAGNIFGMMESDSSAE
ncbi:MAG: VOC family protein [Calditrichaeota bacterium]|nr:VOC family protein [Calditrichota bacterium]